jgi:hypothetical protein
MRFVQSASASWPDLRNYHLTVDIAPRFCFAAAEDVIVVMIYRLIKQAVDMPPITGGREGESI